MGRLGYSSITLTDLTETLPVFLTLESNLPNNIQKKNGSLYTPNFEDGDGVIITPSLFIGSERVDLSGTEEIWYKIGNEQYEYDSQKPNIESGKIGVNSAGQLIIKQNISKSYEIDAFINDFQNKETSEKIQVKSRNKISIFVLEESSSYTAIISSSRDHFDENNTDEITLTAQFYRGTEEVTDATYVWDGLTDNDDSSDDSNISGTGSTLNISRGQVNGTEVISCTMTDNSTDLSFVATKTIRDYVDEYRADLLPSSSLILTPNNTSVDLTARVWHKTGIINNDKEQNRFGYKWQLIKSNETTINELDETSRILTVDTSSEDFPKENFTIACTITIDGKITASAYQNITYSPIEYTVNVEPKQVWLNVDSEGNYSGTRTFNFNFQLLDKEKNLIPKEESDGFNGDENGHWSINTETSSENFWNYNLILTITEEDVSNDSQVFQFNYTYLGKEFSEEVYVIKNYAGKDGTNGASYTIDLSNSFHTFAGEQAHAIAGQIVSFQIQAYYGDDELAIKNVSWEDAPSGLEIKYDKTTKTVTLTTQSGDFLTQDGNIVFTIKVKKKEGVDTLDFIKIFNYSINYNGKSYYLGFGGNNTITYSPSTQTYNPSSITVKAYSRNINGEASVYTDGIIYYSFDRENWVKLTEEDISNYSNIDNIYIRLYSPLMKPSLSLENNRAYLLDEETIPVLTSLDGVEIGGDNLLRWTKTMPIETNKWSLYSVDSTDTDKIYQEQEGDFNSIVFDHSGFWSYVFSPKEKINEEYKDKTFCFSCYVYFDEEIPIVSNAILGAQLRLYSNFSDSFTARRFYKRFAALPSGVTTYPTFISKEEIVANKWIKIYQTFTWNNFIPENPADSITPENCKYFSIALLSGGADTNTRTVKIKKPKLEIGNVPTEWSASPYDISYENINGVNLINGLSSYILTLDKDNNRQIVTNDLDKNQPYVLSWDSCITGGNKFCWALETESEDENLEIKYYQNFDGSNNQNNYIYTLFPNLVDENWSLSFYFGQIIENSDKKLVVNYNSSSTKVTLNRIKLEKGTVKTPFFLTPEQQTEINNEINENYILIGNQFVELGEDFDTLTGKLNQATVDIDRLQGTITTSSEMLTAHADSIRKIENSITIDPGEEPSIVIKTASQDNTQTQAFFLRLTPSRLSFINQNQNEEKELASMSQDTLTITKSNLIESYVEKDFNIGGLNFKITESGVGVIWDIPNKEEKEWRRK